MCGLVKDMFLFIIAYSTIAYVNDTETYTERLDALMTCRLPEHDNANLLESTTKAQIIHG